PISTPRPLRFVAMHMAPHTNMTAPTIMKWATPGGSVSKLAMGSVLIVRSRKIGAAKLLSAAYSPWCAGLSLGAGQIRGADEYNQQVDGNYFESEQVARPPLAHSQEAKSDRRCSFLDDDLLDDLALWTLPLGNADGRQDHEEQQCSAGEK